MIAFRLRDHVSVLLFRALGFRFGRLGKGSRIVWPLRLVGTRYMHLAERVTLQYGAYVAVIAGGARRPELSIGRGTQVGNHSHIICTRRIAIAEDVLIADRVYISDNLHGYRDVTRPVLEQPIRQMPDVEIAAGCWIGENACIVGCRIGRNSVVAANSVVTRDVPDFCVVRGSPAIPVRRYCTERARWLPTDAEGEFLREEASSTAADAVRGEAT
jgi:acetyltransferase-like isoleucine patch superfamily enzyme